MYLSLLFLGGEEGSELGYYQESSALLVSESGGRFSHEKRL
jgi:hypothetical protein